MDATVSAAAGDEAAASPLGGLSRTGPAVEALCAQGEGDPRVMGKHGL